MVELDSSVVTACRKYIPELCPQWKDPRFELVIGDGAAFLRDKREKGEGFDLILLDSTDPVGPAVVLFESPFHQDLHACLNQGGMVVRQAGLPFTMPDLMPFLTCRFREFFPWVGVYRVPVPTYGEEMAFVAASKDGSSMARPRSELKGRFYNSEVHSASFALPSSWLALLEGYRDNGVVPVEAPF